MFGSHWLFRASRGLVLVAVVSLVASGCQWLSFRGGPARTGQSSGINTTNLWYLGEAWNASTGGAVESSPAVDQARHAVYVGSDDRYLHAYNSVDGTPLFIGYVNGGAVRSSPTIAGDRVYVGSDDGGVYGFDANGVNGCGGEPGQLWICGSVFTVKTGGAVRSSPAVVGNVVYVGSTDGTLYAYDATWGGLPIWTAARRLCRHAGSHVRDGHTKRRQRSRLCRLG